MKREADAIVVGTGPGGATVARELARAGRDVLILERGRHHRRLLGTHFGAALMADQFGMQTSREGLQCVRGITTGGSTMLYCGTYQAPPGFIRDELGIDLSAEVEQVRAETGVARLPDRFLEGCSLMLLEAAGKCGYHWEVLEKFIDPDACRPGCSDCMMGCPRGAKWTSRALVEQAVAHGATLVQPVRVEEVTHRNGRATGVRALRGAELVSFEAPLVVVAAGGMGSAPILNRSGVWSAGRGIFVDPLVLVSGIYNGDTPRAGTCYNPPMSVGTWEFHRAEGFMLSPLVDPWMMYIAQMGLVAPHRALRVARYRRVMSIMVKARDDMTGEIYTSGGFTKPLTDADHRKLARGAEVSREILIRAGCKPKSVVVGPVRGAHPGGGCRIGEVVDHDLQTRIENLYVSDASVYPQALGTPMVATVMAMALRLAKHLLEVKEA